MSLERDSTNSSPDIGSWSSDNGVGLSNPQLAHGRRTMLDLVNRLHSTGVQVDIDLPQIAVIGSQSAGKSSLIESISGITLPRAAGTCTRCPTECRLSRSDSPWQCIVSLRFITDATGQLLGQARNEVFGSIMYDQSEVEERIRRAQRAILNPKKPPKDFLNNEDEDEPVSELNFSINCVSLQISGPEVADLSFCDLPGLIASVSSGRGSSNDIALVESLVTAYIKKPSCIILLTVACETDFENQGAHRLAKQHDPEGKRTIGVLTKPDRIPTGEETNWVPFILNEKETLENNWYCVKQPSSSDIKQGTTWSQARQREQDFFATTAPWSELDAVFQKYLKTSNLVDRLSSILSDLISKRLPGIQDELEKSIIRARDILDGLPKPPSDDPRGEISSLLHTFTSDLAQEIRGVPDQDGLLQAIRSAQEKFRRAIRMTAPAFRPFEQKFKRKRHLGPAKFLRSEEGVEWEWDEGSESEDEESESEDEESESEDEGSESEDEVADESYAEPQGPVTKKRKREESSSKIIYIDQVMQRAYQARTRELPGNYPFVVQKSFIDAAIKEWRAPSLIFCKTVHAAVSEHVKGLVNKHFSEFGQGHLEQRVNTIVQQHIKNCLERTEERISWLFGLEDWPFSLNTHYLADYKSKFLAHYKGARQKYERFDIMGAIQSYNSYDSSDAKAAYSDSTASQINGITKIMTGLAEIGMTGIEPEQLARLLPSDRMEPALEIMAEVRAYFQVAYKRFADNIPLAVDVELVRGVERNVLKELYSKLGVNGEDGTRICRELAQESPQVSDKRADLRKKLERLEIASSQLLNLTCA